MHLRFSLAKALSLALAFCSVSTAASSTPTPAGPVRISFVPYAAYFSLETKAADLVDPGMFLAAPGAHAATTLLQLAHAPGIRNASMGDDGTQGAYDANGRSLGFTLQRWFSGTGTIELAPESEAGQAPVVARLANLVPNGRYTLFVVRFPLHPTTYTPVDGTVTAANWFTAGSDGSANSAFSLQGPLTHQTVFELVYHSDRSAVERGLLHSDLGIDAHVQAIARLR